MINAKEELLEHIKQRTIKCATVSLGHEYDENRKTFHLRVGDDLNFFLDQLNFTYDDGYGGQELFGLIWYEDGTWSERGEYDGSEWWEHRSVPNIPEELK